MPVSIIFLLASELADHANPNLSFLADFHRVLPAFFNGTFDKREARARKALADVVAEQKKRKN